MRDFMIEGGWGMWPVLVFGLLLLGSSVLYSLRPHPPRLRFIVAMSVLIAVASAHAMLTDVAMVFKHTPRFPADRHFAVLLTGLKESTRPGILGGAFLVLALVFVAVGVYRLGRRELASPAGGQR
jgi:hypothetical protein